MVEKRADYLGTLRFNETHFLKMQKGGVVDSGREEREINGLNMNKVLD
jgi:hypothetical protein